MAVPFAENVEIDTDVKIDPIKAEIAILRRSFGGEICVGAILLLASAANGLGQYKYTTLTVPGAQQTEPGAIQGKNIVGSYYITQGGNSQAFLYDGTNYTTLSVPGASYAWAGGIDGNNIAGGYYTNVVNGGAQGFLYNGSYTSLNVPGASSTLANGIYGDSIVGYYDVGGVTNYGFLYNGSNYTTLSVPGATKTLPFGINGNNIVGYYYTTNAGIRYTGFVYDGSNYTTLSVPGTHFTYVVGIDGHNFVGEYSTNGLNYQGFLGSPVPRLQGVETGDTIQVTVSMPPPYYPTVIEASTDLVNWVNVYTNTPRFIFMDSTAATSARFYRAVLGP